MSDPKILTTESGAPVENNRAATSDCESGAFSVKLWTAEELGRWR